MIQQRFGLLGSPLKPPMTEIRKPADLKADAAIAASLEGVSHRYGKTLALDNVTLTIPGGCMVGLIGPDGVGKSTLLGLISGVRKIQSGAVWTLVVTCAIQSIARVATREWRTCRKASAAIFTPPSACSRTWTSLPDCSVSRPPNARPVSMTFAQHGPRSVPRSAHRQALRRHEAEGFFVQRADPRSGSCHSR